MTDAITSRIADKYITRDGKAPPVNRHSLSPEQELIVLDALRLIAVGRDSRPLNRNHAQNIARRALIDVMQQVVG